MLFKLRRIIMKKELTRISAGLMALAMVAGLAGCGNGSSSSSSSSGASDSSASGEKKYDKFITVEMFNTQANYQGIMSGWFANIVKKKFNMEINLIAPNVAGGGDTLFQTRSAAGKLGELITIGSENGRLADCVEAGLIMDITDKVKDKTNLQKYMIGIRAINDMVSTDKIYCIPSSVSEQSCTTPSEGLDLTFGPYIRWDYYMEAGAPEMNTLEDLLPVLKKMQDAHPTSDTGKKTYAFSLFKDWDGNLMCLAKQPACMYGVDENGFTLVSADGSEVQSIIDSDSLYVRSLKFFFQANQMGLMDPDSTTQNYDTLFAKYQDGAVLFSPWPWLGQAAYNTVDNKAAGKGFMFAPVKDMKIYSYGCAPANKYVIAVGNEAQDPDRMVDFIDWLYSPEGIELSCAQTASTCGIKGLFWDFNSEGKPELLDFGRKAFSGDATLTMPDEYGGGNYKEGISQLNFNAVVTTDINPDNNAPYNTSLWETTLAANTTALDKSWQEKMGAKTTLEYLQKNNMVAVAPGNTYVPEAAPTDIDNLRNQIRENVIKPYSWQMVFAKDEAEFNSLLKKMQDEAKGLGYDQVLEFDKKIAANLKKARDDAKAAEAAAK